MKQSNLTAFFGKAKTTPPPPAAPAAPAAPAVRCVPFQCFGFPRRPPAALGSGPAAAGHGCARLPAGWTEAQALHQRHRPPRRRRPQAAPRRPGESPCHRPLAFLVRRPRRWRWASLAVAEPKSATHSRPHPMKARTRTTSPSPSRPRLLGIEWVWCGAAQRLRQHASSRVVCVSVSLRLCVSVSLCVQRRPKLAQLDSSEDEDNHGAGDGDYRPDAADDEMAREDAVLEACLGTRHGLSQAGRRPARPGLTPLSLSPPLLVSICGCDQRWRRRRRRRHPPRRWRVCKIPRRKRQLPSPLRSLGASG